MVAAAHHLTAVVATECAQMESTEEHQGLIAELWVKC